MRYLLNGKYMNGDAYFDATVDLIEVARWITEINELYHSLETLEREPWEVIDPSTLELDIEEE